MRRLALAHRPPTGFVRDFVVEADGEHAGRLDIKQGGMLPIADLARYVALAAGVSQATTATRLEAAVAEGTVDADDAGSLTTPTRSSPTCGCAIRSSSSGTGGR